MIRAILDTNLLISAIGWEGKPQQILDYCLENKFKNVTSPQILGEVRDVLFRKKFDFIGKDKKDEFLLLLSELSEIASPKHRVSICRDKDDNKFLELALSADVNIIVSGDDDLLVLKEYKGIKVLSASQFLELLEGKFEKVHRWGVQFAKNKGLKGKDVEGTIRKGRLKD